MILIRVLNKHARANVCFAEEGQRPDYENKKGTIISYSSIPQIGLLRENDKLELTLNDGDMYIMSEKAVGTDWKKRSIASLRHAAGNKKYLQEKR
jgi:hypothetical protein